MSLNEIAYRMKQLIEAQLEARGWRLATYPPNPTDEFGQPWVEFPKGMDVDPYLQAADRIISGDFWVFSRHFEHLGFPPRWNKDPLTGIESPLRFGKTLNYRDEKLVGNIKYLWEPNRHLELVTLAQAWYLSAESKYAEACRVLLDSWFEQCPYPLGPNWTSSLEHAVRLVNWSFAWHLLGGENSLLFQSQDGLAFRSRWLDMIYRHCHFIAGHFSKYSSANNHLLGEYMGLLVGAVTWPIWEQSVAWRDSAFKGFEAEALRQNAPDGVNREQATWYHHEVADMMLICGLVGQSNGIEFSSEYWSRLEAMFDFIASIMDVGGNVPMIGDSDDALMVRFSPKEGFNPYLSLIATGAVLFGRSDFKSRAGKFDDKSRWLLGDEGAARFAKTLEISGGALPQRRAFADGGYYVLGGAWGSKKEVRLVADVGPLGYLSIAAHGHADALAFSLSVGGQEILVDPGTYAYHTQKEWRNYFRGTSAHNTVRIDGLDQSVIGGNFMWLKHADIKLEAWEPGEQRDRLAASHDGYLRLADPVLHHREIVFDKAAENVCVRDTLQCKGRHQVEIYWHCHEDTEVSIEDGGVKIVRGLHYIMLCLSDQRFSVRLAKGEDQPPLGWVSRRFDYKIPSTSIVWSGEVEGLSVLETSLTIFRDN